jgi:hypothetical protein
MKLWSTGNQNLKIRASLDAVTVIAFTVNVAGLKLSDDSGLDPVALVRVALSARKTTNSDSHYPSHQNLLVPNVRGARNVAMLLGDADMGAFKRWLLPKLETM